jgi:hypothetical protein
MFYSLSSLVYIVPAVLAQYGLSIFCLLKLLFLELPKKQFWLWNFFILLAVGVGIITFAVCYRFFRPRVFKAAAAPEQPAPERRETAETPPPQENP